MSSAPPENNAVESSKQSEVDVPSFSLIGCFSLALELIYWPPPLLR